MTPGRICRCLDGKKCSATKFFLFRFRRDIRYIGQIPILEDFGFSRAKEYDDNLRKNAIGGWRLRGDELKEDLFAIVHGDGTVVGFSVKVPWIDDAPKCSCEECRARRERETKQRMSSSFQHQDNPEEDYVSDSERGDDGPLLIAPGGSA